MKSVPTKDWLEKANNFQKRIEKNPYPKNLQFYADIVAKVRVGNSVLDVGCGDQHLKEVLPPGISYCGMDAFPRNEFVFKGKIEDERMTHLFSKTLRIETVFAMAMLDNVENLNKALENIAKIAVKNVVILTGINIEPDDLHTIQIDMVDFVAPFKDWTITVMEEIKPKVFLLEFTKL